MATYRVYETERNAAGGYENLGTGWEYVEATTAQEAAETAAEARRDIPECRGLTVVATDDDVDSAYVDV